MKEVIITNIAIILFGSILAWRIASEKDKYEMQNQTKQMKIYILHKMWLDKKSKVK